MSDLTSPAPVTGLRPAAFRHNWRWLTLLALALFVGIGTFGGRYATQVSFDAAAQRGENTLRLAIAVLRGQMERFERLPQLIADHDIVRAVVTRPDDPGAVAEANAYLAEINTLLQSSDIYVMLPDGTTIAANNHDTDFSFVGQNFAYRPYFFDAASGGEGRFFALGTTSLKRGYYFGAPIREGDAVLGVVAFKIDVDAIEETWRGGDYEIIVTDPEGIIFMSSRADWHFASTLPLTSDRRARTAATQRYANARLRELPITREEFAGHSLMGLTTPTGMREYLIRAEEMPEAGWTVQVLLDTASVRTQALTAIMVALLLVGLGTMGAATWLQRRARLRDRMQMQQEARAELERRVIERTQELATVNHRLEGEVAERRATEAELRRTQASLVQAGKLAALGQMSAALSHEFNQPLAAARNYADNALVLIERDRVSEAGLNIGKVVGLVDRMAALSRHLRNFARKPNDRLDDIALSDVLAETQEIVAFRLRAAGAELLVDTGPQPIHIRAGSVRLQQVLVNLITNAADAVEGSADRRIHLVARQDEGQAKGRVTITVRDHGPGVPPAIAERIFDPFFTTKGVGRGLGLGLSISYNIIKDFGGELRLDPAPGGGACFVVELLAVGRAGQGRAGQGRADGDRQDPSG
ncbi:ATP-binding protein [Halodurantibacterium flavum]|uniref:histidine kinase n=1 Tax=Halodurantibacterium flavum TaxID=1382802 RepID=A0ABW4S9P6_9RHOB